MHFMLQKEVVERMAAGPGSKVYGRLSVMLQAYCTVDAAVHRAAGRVPAGAEGRFGGRAAGAARGRATSAMRDPHGSRRSSAPHSANAARHCATRWMAWSTANDAGRGHPSRAARRAACGRGFRAPGQRRRRRRSPSVHAARLHWRHGQRLRTSTSTSPPATSTNNRSPNRIATSSPTPSTSATTATCRRSCSAGTG